MRSILMFCPQFRPAVGGAERQAEKLSLALAAAGCRVTIVTPRLDPGSPATEECGGVRIERFSLLDLARHLPFRGIALVNIPAILLQTMIAVHSRAKRHDVLHCHSASLQTAGAALAGRLCAIPVLCKAATADQKSDLGEIERTGMSGYFVAWLLRKLVTNWVATTEAVKHALVVAGVSHRRISRIPNGVNVSMNLPLPNRPCGDGVRRFLYLGRISRNARRDLPTLVRAFERLAAQHLEIELALVGGGDLFEETSALVARCDAHDRIKMPGFDDSAKWLLWADCFVLPSRLEGLSNALLEAMAAGLPCIANDIPPNREVLADGAAGVLVPLGEEDQLYRAMLLMINDSSHASKMRVAAFNRARTDYGFEAVTASYLALYDGLAKSSDSEFCPIE